MGYSSSSAREIFSLCTYSFEESIQLGSYPAGSTYTVGVNGTQVAEFTP
jgi:hypothetical protein